MSRLEIADFNRPSVYIWRAIRLGFNKADSIKEISAFLFLLYVEIVNFKFLK